MLETQESLENVVDRVKTLTVAWVKVPIGIEGNGQLHTEVPKDTLIATSRKESFGT